MSRRIEREKKDEQSRPKSESQQRQQGGPLVSKHDVDRHEKDESRGSKEKHNKETIKQHLILFFSGKI